MQDFTGFARCLWAGSQPYQINPFHSGLNQYLLWCWTISICSPRDFFFNLQLKRLALYGNQSFQMQVFKIILHSSCHVSMNFKKTRMKWVKKTEVKFVSSELVGFGNIQNMHLVACNQNPNNSSWKPKGKMSWDSDITQRYIDHNMMVI